MPDIGPGVSPATADATVPVSGRRVSDKPKLRVFISYSRGDLDFATQLEAALTTCGFDCVLDQQDISPGEDWRARLSALIRGSDTVVFVLTPASAGSRECARELDESDRQGKRVLPVVCRGLGDAKPPARIAALNYVFFYPEPTVEGSGFGLGLKDLVEALNTDFDWLREHTRYLARATEWNEGGRPANRLLTGSDIAAAKAWAARRPRTAPEVTALQLDFVRASEEEAEARSSAERRQLEAMAEANERSAKALSEKEAAVKQEQEAQRRRARWAATATVVGAVAIILAAAAGLAFWQARKYSGDASEVIYELLSKMGDQQRAKAFGLFQRAVMLGNASPLRYLGVAYRNGWGVTKNVDTAINELDRAAARGDSDAMDNLGSINESGEAGGAPKYDEARSWYEKAAKLGNLNSMNNLGRLYDTGRAVPLDAAEAAYWSTGFPSDTAKAIYWYDLAARADTPSSKDETAKGAEADAAFHLGQHYETGRGVPQDYDNARDHYEDAAKANHADAMVRLAALYEAGRGVPQDYGVARKLYENAAKLANNANAMFRLGQLYEEGRQDVAQDAGKMIAWYERAADWGHAGAKLKLSELYGKGVWIAPDQAKAREWYGKARASYEEAAKNGDAQARERLQTLPVVYSGTGG